MVEPRISVIMGIYNCADTLDEAINSILNQTFSDWEFILCDDGSIDNTYDIAKRYADLYSEKFILLKNFKNMGLNYTLNHCLEHAKGDYIARMDGDDICDPTRLGKEIKFLDEHPEYAVVSTEMVMFDEQGDWGKTSVIERPTQQDFCLHTPFFCHAASMIRRSVIEEVGRYTQNPKLLRVEDCDLWFKIYAKGYKGANIPEVLYKMRDDRNAFCRRSIKGRFNSCYVLYHGFKMIHMPWYKYIYVLRNIVIELLKCFMPEILYRWIHRKRYSRSYK